MNTIGYAIHELVKGGEKQFGTQIKELLNPPIILSFDTDPAYIVGEG